MGDLIDGEFSGDGIPLHLAAEVRDVHGDLQDEGASETVHAVPESVPPREPGELTRQDWDILGWLALDLVFTGALGAGVVLGGGRLWLALAAWLFSLFLSLVVVGRMAEGTSPLVRPFWRPTLDAMGRIWVALQFAVVTATGLIAGILLSTVRVTFLTLPLAHGLLPVSVIVAGMITGANLLVPAGGVQRPTLVKVAGAAVACAGIALGVYVLV